MRAIDNTDMAFIKATYADPDWHVDDIAEKLGISGATVRKYGRQFGKKRSSAQRPKAPRTNWEALWFARQSGLGYEKVAEQVGMHPVTAKSAMRRMLDMTEAERIITWNLYRKSKGMPLFTKC